jgi:hypothetical protein
VDSSSIIIGNFSSKTGSAFLTQPQREWIDLQKLIKRQKPSKRPQNPPKTALRSWCFSRAVNKHGWWSRVMTFLFVIHIFALMCVFRPLHVSPPAHMPSTRTQTFNKQKIVDTVRSNESNIVPTTESILIILPRHLLSRAGVCVRHRHHRSPIWSWLAEFPRQWLELV